MGEKRKSVMVGIAAWAFITLGGYHAARAAYDNITLTSMFSSPSFLLGLAGSVLPVELPPLARLAAAHIRLVFAGYFFVSLSVFAAGLGLLFRKPWALVFTRWFFFFAAACCFAVLVVPGLLVPGPLVMDGRELAPEFNAAVGMMRTQVRVVSALLCSVFFLAARRFSRPEIRSEFGVR